jgi:50S ribosomal protein L16 3-hydroxylase
VLRLPGDLTAQQFLTDFWQKQPLFMPGATQAIRPAVSRNELAWLATLVDVESRIVFVERHDGKARYRAETGPFESAYLQALPKRNWTLLVHDIEKHLPPLRRLFALVPFIPDWRIDDLMISFAAPGGGVGPHTDQYDVFLCQGIGERDWRYSINPVHADKGASETLRLSAEFSGDARFSTRQGDVLYLPPGIPHWGVATKACMTYSIGMRAPSFYADPDLQVEEAVPGYLSPAARKRAGRHADELGLRVTETKEWLAPERPTTDDVDALLHGSRPALRLHGMARLAYDDEHVYLNGRCRNLPADDRDGVATLCRERRLARNTRSSPGDSILRWMLHNGAFELPETEP